jgi:hypothetical protein
MVNIMKVEAAVKILSKVPLSKIPSAAECST